MEYTTITDVIWAILLILAIIKIYKQRSKLKELEKERNAWKSTAYGNVPK